MEHWRRINSPEIKKKLNPEKKFSGFGKKIVENKETFYRVDSLKSILKYRRRNLPPFLYLVAVCLPIFLSEQKFFKFACMWIMDKPQNATIIIRIWDMNIIWIDSNHEFGIQSAFDFQISSTEDVNDSIFSSLRNNNGFINHNYFVFYTLLTHLYFIINRLSFSESSLSNITDWLISNDYW